MPASKERMRELTKRKRLKAVSRALDFPEESAPRPEVLTPKARKESSKWVFQVRRVIELLQKALNDQESFTEEMPFDDWENWIETVQGKIKRLKLLRAKVQLHRAILVHADRPLVSTAISPRERKNLNQRRGKELEKIKLLLETCSEEERPHFLARKNFLEREVKLGMDAAGLVGRLKVLKEKLLRESEEFLPMAGMDQSTWSKEPKKRKKTFWLQRDRVLDQIEVAAVYIEEFLEEYGSVGVKELLTRMDKQEILFVQQGLQKTRKTVHPLLIALAEERRSKLQKRLNRLSQEEGMYPQKLYIRKQAVKKTLQQILQEPRPYLWGLDARSSKDFLNFVKTKARELGALPPSIRKLENIRNRLQKACSILEQGTKHPDYKAAYYYKQRTPGKFLLTLLGPESLKEFTEFDQTTLKLLGEIKDLIANEEALNKIEEIEQTLLNNPRYFWFEEEYGKAIAKFGQGNSAKKVRQNYYEGIRYLFGVHEEIIREIQHFNDQLGKKMKGNLPRIQGHCQRLKVSLLGLRGRFEEISKILHLEEKNSKPTPDFLERLGEINGTKENGAFDMAIHECVVRLKMLNLIYEDALNGSKVILSHHSLHKPEAPTETLEKKVGQVIDCIGNGNEKSSLRGIVNQMDKTCHQIRKLCSGFTIKQPVSTNSLDGKKQPIQ